MLNGIAAISLLLCVAMTGLWVNGDYFLGREGTWENVHSDGFGESKFTFDFSGGGVGISEFWSTVKPSLHSPSWDHFYLASPWPPPERSWRQLGNSDYPSRWQDSSRRWVFMWRGPVHEGYYDVSLRELIVPAWLPVLLLLISSGLSFVASRRILGRSLRAGACAQCGYDLRATPDRCPECGTVPPTMASS